MSTKYRCPACGATNKEAVAHCRLCGHSMDPSHVSDLPAPEARPVEARSSSTKGVVLLGIGIVLAIVAIAVALGVVRGNKAIDTAIDKIPGVGAEQSDGWSAIPGEKAAELGYTVELPGDRTFQTVTFPGVEGDKLTGYSAAIGKDYELFAGTGTVNQPSGTTDTDFLKQTAQLTCAGEEPTANGTTICTRYKTGDGGEVLKVAEIKVWGPNNPALEVDVKSGKINDKDAYARTLYLLKKSPDGNGTAKLYVVQAKSVYRDIPQFERMLNSFGLA